MQERLEIREGSNKLWGLLGGHDPNVPPGSAGVCGVLLYERNHLKLICRVVVNDIG